MKYTLAMKEDPLPIIDHDVCIKCGACSDICPDRILQSGEEGVIEIIGDSCMGCGHCYSICPVGAVTVPWLMSDLDLKTISEDVNGTTSSEIKTEGLLGLMRARRSCRIFKTDPVDLSILTDLVSIGTTAPSGTNSQGWQFVILPERNDVLGLGEVTANFYRKLNLKAANPLYRFVARLFVGDALRRYYEKYFNTIEQALLEWDEKGIDRLFHGAPSAIIVAADKSASCPKEDALLATQNILLAAEAMGVSTCLIGFVVEAAKRDRQIASLLRFSSDEKIYSVIACGYPAITFKRPAGRRKVNPRIIRLSKDNNMKGSRQDKDAAVKYEKKASIVLYSFGFKHGVPVDANMVWDVRFLPNPYWHEELRSLSGRDNEILDFVLKSDQGKKFLELLKPLLTFLLDSNSNLDKKNLRFAIGCTGGRHRSVAVVEELRRFLSEKEVELNVFHRDIDRE